MNRKQFLWSLISLWFFVTCADATPPQAAPTPQLTPQLTTPTNYTATSSKVTTTTPLINIPRSRAASITIRAIIVVAAISALVIVYFVARAVCSSRRRNRNRRYGMLKDQREGGNMEMQPLSECDDDDDDDLTLFDASQRRLTKR